MIPMNATFQALEPGDRVLVRHDDGHVGQHVVKARPWQLGHGAWVVGLEGMVGGYSLERVIAFLGAKPKADLCAVCQHRPAPENRSVCYACVPAQTESELVKARDRVRELEHALRYAAECSTLEMVRDVARGMGVIQ